MAELWTGRAEFPLPPDVPETLQTQFQQLMVLNRLYFNQTLLLKVCLVSLAGNLKSMVFTTGARHIFASEWSGALLVAVWERLVWKPISFEPFEVGWFVNWSHYIRRGNSSCNWAFHASLMKLLLEVVLTILNGMPSEAESPENFGSLQNSMFAAHQTLLERNKLKI